MRSKFINADSKLRSKRIATEDSETNFYGGGKARGGQEKFLEDEEIMPSFRLHEIRGD